jgi:hypothetical protein
MSANRLFDRATLMPWAVGAFVLVLSTLATAADKVVQMSPKETPTYYSVKDLITQGFNFAGTEGAMNVLVHYPETWDQDSETWDQDFAHIMERFAAGKLGFAEPRWYVIPTVVPAGDSTGKGMTYGVWGQWETAPKMDVASYLAMPYEGFSAYKEIAPTIEPFVAFALSETDFVPGKRFRLTNTPITISDDMKTLSLKGTTIELELERIREEALRNPWTKFSTLVSGTAEAEFQAQLKGEANAVQGPRLGKVAEECIKQYESWSNCYNKVPGFTKGSAGWIKEGFEGFHAGIYRDSGEIGSIWLPSPAESLIYRQGLRAK